MLIFKKALIVSLLAAPGLAKNSAIRGGKNTRALEFDTLPEEGDFCVFDRHCGSEVGSGLHCDQPSNLCLSRGSYGDWCSDDSHCQTDRYLSCDTMEERCDYDEKHWKEPLDCSSKAKQWLGLCRATRNDWQFTVVLHGRIFWHSFHLLTCFYSAFNLPINQDIARAKRTKGSLLD